MKNKRLIEIEKVLKTRVPITQHLDFSLESWTGEELVLKAPFDKNKNHHNTIFGGSLAMSAIVSGYCLTFMALEDALGKSWGRDHTLVIKDFSCKYLRPVTGDIETISKAASDTSTEKFVSDLLNLGKSQLKVVTYIEDEHRHLACSATYVAYNKV